MARLHEYQGKALLKQFKVTVPQGRVAATPEEARAIAEEIGKPVMVKAQAWITGRASVGGIRKASTPDEAAEARAILGLVGLHRRACAGGGADRHRPRVRPASSWTTGRRLRW